MGKAEQISKSIQVQETQEREEENLLPSWARSLRSSSSGVEQTDASTSLPFGRITEKQSLPNWVQRAIDDDDNNEPIKVVDDVDVLVELNSDKEEAVEDEKDSEFDTSLRIIGGSPLPKSQIRTSVDRHISLETEESLSKPHIRGVHGKQTTDETTESSERRPHVRAVAGSNINTESEQSPERIHTLQSSSMWATKESDTFSDESKPHLKCRKDQQVNQSSVEERKLIPHRANVRGGLHSISEQTESLEWKVKKRNVFGHASEMSKIDSKLSVPKMRTFGMRHVSAESDFRDFSIKPKIRINSKVSVNSETEQVDFRSSVRVQAARHVSTESALVDEHARAVDRFRSRNVKGHISDSSVQKLLYGDRVDRREKEEIKGRMF